MPKVKTKSSAKKRFKVTAKKRVKFKRSFGRHILSSKNSKRKRRISQFKVAAGDNMRGLRSMLGMS